MTKDAALHPFAADFPDQDETRWRALAEAALRGAPWERLVGRTADGVALAPLYREADVPSGKDTAGLPGHAPFTRGAVAALDPLQPWHVRQRFAHPDPAQTNTEILADLDAGVSAIELVIGDGGVAITDAETLKAALDGVLVDLAPIALDAGAFGVEAARLLADYLGDVGEAAATPGFDIDPVGVLMRTGVMDEDAFAQAAALATGHRDKFAHATWLRADARPVHEAGGSEAQEIAVALTSGIEALRALTHAGLHADEAARAIAITLAVGPDVLVETAKLRALRLTWARVLEASGVRAESRAARLHAVTSRRMMTRHDPWTNMLRTTAAGFAAAVGGAQAITVLPLTEALGLPTPFARRMARNTQLIVMEESNLGRVIDPAGGAWFVEKLTRDLAESAWQIMRGIEAQGGIVAALQAGELQKQVGIVRAKREKAIATRRESITGITDFPLLGAALPAVLSVPPASAGSTGPAKAGGTSVAPALAPIRWAEPFEALRDKGEAANARVFFANLGRLAEFSPRANFAKNLFGAGGVDAIGSDVEHAGKTACVAAFTASGATVAVLTGADARYATEAGAAATALKATGCVWVVYAGKPADEAALRAAGVDQFVIAGQDALEALRTLHAALGIAT